MSQSRGVQTTPISFQKKTAKWWKGWKVLIFQQPLVAGEGHLPEWLQCPDQYLGIHGPFHTEEVASAVTPPPWRYSWQNGCSALFMTSPQGMHYQSQYGYKTGTKSLFCWGFMTVTAEVMCWLVANEGGEKQGATLWAGKHPDERNVHTQPFSCLSSLGKALYCTKCLRVSVQWSDNITNQSRKVLKMCENGKEVPIQ